MSWLSQNYEKAAIGGAAVAALGLALLGWSKIGAVAEDFAATTAGEGKNDTAVPNANLVPNAVASLGLDHAWQQGMAGERAVDLVTGIPLFIHKNAPDKAVDLVNGEPVHPPIKNIWWLKYRLDPGFADSPSQDPDNDGFSNLEEYQGGSDPTDTAAHPALIAKLKYEGDESLNWCLRPTFPDGNKLAAKYVDGKGGGNQTPTGAAIEPGQIFFADGAMKGRFKFNGWHKRQVMNQKIHQMVEEQYAEIEDLRPNKVGTKYELPPFGEALIPQHSKYDRSAVLTLEAAGQAGKRQTIEENTTFGLPLDDSKKDYLLKKVTPEAVEVEYTDPVTKAKKTVTIRKGAFPEMSP